VAALSLRLVGRWRASDRAERAAAGALVLLVIAAIGVRAWLMAIYRPAFLGFSDSSAYLSAAAHNIFADAQHPAGYPFFLRLAHHLSDQLSFVIVVQHALGVASGLLLYVSLRRLRVAPWVGLIPAAIVFFGGTGLLLEHAPLADPLLTFLQSVAIYAVIRTLDSSALRWPVLAALATGAAFWVKTIAISSAILIPVVLLFAAAGNRRRRLLAASLSTAVVALMIFAYVGTQAYFTGRWGYERQSAWNLYGRVATFADCSRFTPPKGTAFLCPTEPPSRRNTGNYFQYDAHAPAVRRYHGPARAPGSANAVLQRFSVAAIEKEPGAYAAAVMRGLSFYVLPREGEGYSPQALTDALLDTGTQHTGNSIKARPAVALLYPTSTGLHYSSGALTAISWYERHTRLGGAVMFLLLGAALAGPFVLRGRTRTAAVFLGLTALLSITVAIATNSYDARYACPTFGPLAASAALGGWGLARLLSGAVRRRAGSVHIARIRRNSGVAGC
jgi:hypothetical protein